MIVSNKKKFVFIHVPKTGGTSLSVVLRKYASYSVAREYKIEGKKFLDVSLMKHATALDVKKYVPKAKWDKYFKFCFVRNPWDLFVSLYSWLKPRSKKLKSKSFSKFVTNFYHNLDAAVLMGKGQYNFMYNLSGKCLVDFVGKFEDYDSSIRTIEKRVGIPITSLVRWINKTKHAPYRKYYNNKTKSMIAEVCANDIKCFGYTF